MHLILSFFSKFLQLWLSSTFITICHDVPVELTPICHHIKEKKKKTWSFKTNLQIMNWLWMLSRKHSFFSIFKPKFSKINELTIIVGQKTCIRKSNMWQIHFIKKQFFVSDVGFLKKWESTVFNIQSMQKWVKNWWQIYFA